MRWSSAFIFTAVMAGFVWASMAQQEDGIILTFSPSSLTFNATAGGTAPPSQRLSVRASSATEFTARASGESNGAMWLSISPSSGALNPSQDLIVSVNPAGLEAGAYDGTISLVVSGGAQTVSVRFILAQATPTITLRPTALTFNVTAGGAAPASQTLSVNGANGTNFTVSAAVKSGGTNWLSISPSGDLTINRNLTVSVDPAGLAAGTYSGTIPVVSGDLTQTAAVTLIVGPAIGVLTVTPTSLMFQGTLNRADPASQTLSVNGTSANFTASASVQRGVANWLGVSPGTLSTDRTLAVSASLAGLAAGSYTGSISVTANGSTRSVPVTFVVNSAGAGGGTALKLIGWNDLGMHCDDGQDFSVFGVLPPFNTIHAHLIDSAGSLVVTPAGYTVTYQAINDPLTNTMNTSSAPKTNFWQYAEALGFGKLAADMGVAGFAMPGPGNTPQAMKFSAGDNTWLATGIPITNYADSANAPYPRNPFPMMRLVAKNQGGAVVATTDIVLPISDEMSCNTCHASNTGTGDAKPANGWVNNSDLGKDVKLNILRKHDDRFNTNTLFLAASAARGYSTAGLEAQSAIKPFLCASCHGSNALGLAGYMGVPPLTTSIHSMHATVTDPATTQTMGSATTRESCYHCHPGPATQCLRGAMATLKTGTGANAVECQSCHGSMTAVADPTRQGWLNEPGCQSCHTGTVTSQSAQVVFTSVFLSDGKTVRPTADQTFATNVDTPGKGLSLYRFSKGHGGLQCEACHGSTHAEYPTVIANDNVQSTSLQGHTGTLVECVSCHSSVPNTVTGGPHGLHPVGASWVSSHPDAAEGNQAACQACHGMDYRGTVLSKVQSDRTLAGKSFPHGTVIGCYSCHNGPNGGG